MNLSPTDALPAPDLDYILARTADLWAELRRKKLFITGGTGFVGTWLLESFCRANEVFGLRACACVLTRSAAGFYRRYPALAGNAALHLHEGKVEEFNFPTGQFSHIIHAATESNSQTYPLDPGEHFTANVRGTERVLEFARKCGARRLLFTSSGAVYGPQPAELALLPEDHQSAPNLEDSGTAYGQSKRASEFLCLAMSQRTGVSVTIARLFTLVGPLLKLNANFAVGNFIRDALTDSPIEVKGDGTSFRSYLYAADLAIWLWTILLRGGSGRIYNVGSDQPISIAALAQVVAATIAPGRPISIAQKPDPSKPAARYVPAITRARQELGLDVWISLTEAILRTAQWHRN